MKKSIVISTAKTKFKALTFQEDLTQNIQKVAELGFDGVELAVRNPKDLDVIQLKEILTRTGLKVSAIGTGQAYGEEGLSFTSASSEIRQKAIDRIKAQIDFAVQIGNPIIIIGLIRGVTSSSIGWEKAWNLALSAVRECAVYGQKEGTKLAIEPINRYETDLINTLDEAGRFLEEVGEKNVGILPDTFHMNIEEPSIELSIKKVQDKIIHFHIADSNRWPPKYGHLNFPSILEALKEIGYSGFISAETLPKPNPEEAAILVATWMHTYIQNF